MSRGHAPRIWIATNNGDVGGGEMMLLSIAAALRGLDISVTVIGPEEPGDLVRTAREAGHDTLSLRARDRIGYMAALAAWRMRHPSVPLWCNGLVPSTATAGAGPRIVHLHLLPGGVNRAAARLARAGADTVLVPSRYMADHVRGAEVLQNWTPEIPYRPAPLPEDGPVRIGFLGRLTRDKGVHVLARALRTVISESERDVRLVLAGENRFGDAKDDAALARALSGLEQHVERWGWVERETFFDQVDLAVFPSVFPEPFGLVAAEAMASGTPFVISDAGGLPEVAGARHPWVSRSGDSQDLARVVLEALQSGAVRRSEVLAVARERWEQHYSPEQGRLRVARLIGALDGRRMNDGRRAASVGQHRRRP